MVKRPRHRHREHQHAQFFRPDLEAARDPTGEATARLRRLVKQHARIEHEIDAEVDRLHGWGFDWPTIAAALGVTRQAAQQRHQRRLARQAEQGIRARAVSGVLGSVDVELEHTRKGT